MLVVLRSLFLFCTLLVKKLMNPKKDDQIFTSMYDTISERQKLERLILPPNSVLLCLIVVDNYGYTFKFTHFTWVDLQDVSLREMISESWNHFPNCPEVIGQMFSLMVEKFMSPDMERGILSELMDREHPCVWCVGNYTLPGMGFFVQHQ